MIVLAEDDRQGPFVRRYLLRRGTDNHAIRLRVTSKGSGEQWVREQFAAEVAALRQRRTRAATWLIVVVDADVLAVPERLLQLDLQLAQKGAGVRTASEPIAILIPRRNVETWILCLNGQAVDEVTDYKNRRMDWAKQIRSGVETLYDWTRTNAAIPAHCTASLQTGISELERL